MTSCCVALGTISSHLWWSTIMWEKGMYMCMCDWVILLYSRKLTEHCKPAIVEKKSLKVEKKKRRGWTNWSVSSFSGLHQDTGLRCSLGTEDTTPNQMWGEQTQARRERCTDWGVVSKPVGSGRRLLISGIRMTRSLSREQGLYEALLPLGMYMRMCWGEGWLCFLLLPPPLITLNCFPHWKRCIKPPVWGSPPSHALCIDL